MVSFLQSPDENSDHYDHSKKSRRRRRGRTFDDASIPSMHEIVRSRITSRLCRHFAILLAAWRLC
jgi:hypothetical protein